VNAICIIIGVIILLIIFVNIICGIFVYIVNKKIVKSTYEIFSNVDLSKKDDEK